MWPFKRKAEAQPDHAPAIPVPVMRQEWKQLPAMQRTIGEHPLTAPPKVFAADLVTHQDPSVTSGPVGHDVTHEAPAGLISAFARPSTRDNGPAMIHRPRLQRQARSSGEALDDAGAAEVGGPDQDNLASAETVREVPVVASQPVAQRLTTTAPDVAPVPVGKGLALQSRPQMQRSITAGPLSPDLSGPSPNLTAALTAASPGTTEAATLVPAGPQRLTLGQSRRLGLGAPLRQVPMSAMQRAADLPLARQPSAPADVENFLPEATPERIETPPSPPASIQASPLGADRPDHEPISADSPSMSAFVLESRPAIQRAALDLRLAPSARADASESPAPIAASESGQTVAPDVDLSGTLAGAAAAPGPTSSTSARDVAPTTAVQRSLEPDSTSAAAEARISRWRRTTVGDDAPAQARPPFSASNPMATRVASLIGTRSLASLQRAAPPERAAISERATGGSLAPMQRAISEFPQATSERGRSAATAVIQRSELAIPDGHGTMNPDDGVMPALTLAATPGSAQSWQGAPAVQRLLRQPQPAAVQRSEMTLAPVASVASVQRATQIAESAIAVASQPMISAQRESLASEPAWPSGEPSVQAATATSAATSGASGPSGAAHPDENLDALAGKLYDRIRNRLKSELLLDRERAGLLTDLRG